MNEFEKLRSLIKEKGYSYEVFSRIIIGHSYTYFHKQLLKGKMNVRDLYKINETLNCSFDDWLPTECPYK